MASLGMLSNAKAARSQNKRQVSHSRIRAFMPRVRNAILFESGTNFFEAGAKSQINRGLYCAR